MFNAWVASLFGKNNAGFVSFKGQLWHARFHRGQLVDADRTTFNAYGLMKAHFDQIGF